MGNKTQHPIEKEFKEVLDTVKWSIEEMNKSLNTLACANNSENTYRVVLEIKPINNDRPKKETI